MATAATPEKTKQPGPNLWLSIAVFVIGAVLIAIGGTIIFGRVFESQTVDSFVVPGAEVRSLDPGDYDVFGLAGSFTDFDGDPTFARGDVTVTWIENGETLPVEQQAFELDLERQFRRYERVGTFTVTTEGTYRIDVATNDDSRAVVSRVFFEELDELIGPAILLGIGSLILLAGVIMIIVGIVRRGRAQKRERPSTGVSEIYQPPPSAAPPAPPPPPAPGEQNTPW